VKFRASVLVICLICAAFAGRQVECAPWSAFFRSSKRADTAAHAARASSKAHAALASGRVADRALKASTTNEDRGTTELPTSRPDIAVKDDGLSRV
jgi:hypothetical protein